MATFKNEPCWMTTVDNPFNYFEQFDEWYMYEATHHGYRPEICSWISGSLAQEGYNENLDPAYANYLTETVINRIIKTFPKYNFIKVTENSYKKNKNGLWTVVPVSENVIVSGEVD